MGLGELGHRVELAGEGFEAVDDVLQDVGSWLQPAMIVITKLCRESSGGLWLTDLTNGPTVTLVFPSGFFILNQRPQTEGYCGEKHQICHRRNMG